MSDLTTARPRRRRPTGPDIEKRPEETGDVAPDAVSGTAIDNLPAASDTIAIAAADSGDLGDNLRDSKGKFAPGNPGGPGRGHRRASPDADPGREGKGHRGEGVKGVLDAVTAAIADDPDKFAASLVRSSPVSAAQFVMSLGKYAGQAEPSGPPVVVIETAFPGPLAPQSDLDLYMVTARAEAAERELILARQELADSRAALDMERRMQPRQAPAEPAASWTCTTCQRLVGITRTYPVGQNFCSACGSIYDASTGQVREPTPGAGAGQGGSCIALAVRVDGGGDGWCTMTAKGAADDS